MCGVHMRYILHFVMMLMMRWHPASSSCSCRSRQQIRISSSQYNNLFTLNSNDVIRTTPLECVYFCLTSDAYAITAVYDEGKCVCTKFNLDHTSGEETREVLRVVLRKGKIIHRRRDAKFPV